MLAKRACIMWTLLVVVLGFLYWIGATMLMDTAMEINFGIKHTASLWQLVFSIGPIVLGCLGWEHPELFFFRDEINMRRFRMAKDFWDVIKNAPNLKLDQYDAWIISQRYGGYVAPRTSNSGQR